MAQQHLFSEKGVPDQSMDVDNNTPPTFYETFLSINVDPGDTPLKPPPLLELLVSEVRQVFDDPRTRDRNQIMTRDQEVQQQIQQYFQFQISYPSYLNRVSFTLSLLATWNLFENFIMASRPNQSTLKYLVVTVVH